MSLEQYKDATRKELWDILQIQVQVLQSEIELTTELRKQIAELEQQLEQYQTVEKWVQCFTMSDLEVHNLEQRAKGIEDAVTKLERPDVPLAPSLILNDDLLDYAARLRNQAAKLKEQE